MVPKDLKFMESHEWARPEADGTTASLGISVFAVEQLGDIVYLELPEVGASIEKGQPFGTIESVKAASDLYSPVSGKVIEVNSDLTEKLELFADDPYTDACMFKVELSDPGQLDSLMDAEKYEEYLKGL